MSTMRSHRSILPAAAVVIALFLAAAPASAVPVRWDFGGWIRGFISALWAENGCGVISDGHCGAAPAPTENGCGADPNGGCKQ